MTVCNLDLFHSREFIAAQEAQVLKRPLTMVRFLQTTPVELFSIKALNSALFMLLMGISSLFSSHLYSYVVIGMSVS